MDIITARDVRFLYENGETGESNERDAQAGPAGRENAPAQPVMAKVSWMLSQNLSGLSTTWGNHASSRLRISQHLHFHILFL